MIFNKKILNLETANYSFSDYFKIDIRAEDLASLFDYTYELKEIPFQKNELSDNLKEWIEDFLTHYDKLRNLVNLSNEMAIREFLISPIIFELVKRFDVKVDIENSVYYSEVLKGSIDYILRKNSNFIAIEAKKSDMTRGFNQLLSELIALDKIIEDDNILLYGVVTTGNEWNFALLDRKTKNIIQDKKSLYLVRDLEEIFQLIIEILEN